MLCGLAVFRIARGRQLAGAGAEKGAPKWPIPLSHCLSGALKSVTANASESIPLTGSKSSWERMEHLKLRAANAEPKKSGDVELKPAVAKSKTRAPVGRASDKALKAAILDAENASQRSSTLEALKGALEDYRHCEVKSLARNLVFSDGNPDAHVMLVGEAPGMDEDRLGRPFVGLSGKLVDKMFAEIGLSRTGKTPEDSLYISNILPWRPPGNRNPTMQEIKMMLPFVTRHIELAGPKLLVLLGNISCEALLGQGAITNLRGNWRMLRDIPVMPMFHPAYLLRNPVAKGKAWIDLLKIRKALSETGNQ